MGILIFLLFAAAIFYALFRGSIAKSNDHKVSQAAWRNTVVEQLGLVEYVQSDGWTLGFDKGGQDLAVVYPSGSGYWIPIDCIRRVETNETRVATHEQTEETSVNRGSQIGGALIGGAIAGPVGLAVGGLTGTRTTSSRGTSETLVSALELRLDLRNDAIPSLRLTSSASEYDPAGKTWVGGITEAEKFADLLKWEVEKLSDKPTDVTGTEIFKAINVVARPQNAEGWWTSTFGG